MYITAMINHAFTSFSAVPICHSLIYSLRESSINMTGGMKILMGAPKIFIHPKEGLKKLGGGGGLRKFVYFKTNRRWGS